MTTALLSFALASFLIELTPGPNMAYLANLAADRGRRPGFAAVAGVALGLALLGLLAIFGLGTLVMDKPWLYQTLLGRRRLPPVSRLGGLERLPQAHHPSR